MKIDFPCCSLKPRPPLRIGSPRDWAPLYGARAQLVQLYTSRWINGTQITWTMRGGREGDRAAVGRAVATWQVIAGGLKLQQVSDWNSAMVRITFDEGDGSWSYVGPDCMKAPAGEATMNFGWPLTTDWGRDTALHEWGHALGAWHEHQNPRAGIVWNRQAVLAYFSGPPNNWDHDTIERNILQPLDIDRATGSMWDRNSIMHYPFEAGLILEPSQYRTTPLLPLPGLSPKDRELMSAWYPGGATPTEPPKPVRRELLKGIPVVLGSKGAQLAGQEFRFTMSVKGWQRWTVKTEGDADTTMVLKQPNGAQLMADDDSGYLRNAQLSKWEWASKTYHLDLRVNWHAGEVRIVRT